jgi:hypothetical protein
MVMSKEKLSQADKDALLTKALSFDALQEAEKLTEKSYKDDKSTMSIGMMLQIENSGRRAKMLADRDDTMFSETTAEYLRKVTDFGFVQFHIEEFLSDSSNEMEGQYFMFHPDYSILLIFDTFRGNCNGGQFHYNWIPNDKYKYPPHFSGVWYDNKTGGRPAQDELPNEVLVAVGYTDCREAIKFNIQTMLETGTFVKKWVLNDISSTLHHQDWKDLKVDGETRYAGVDDIMMVRWSHFPPDILDLIKLPKRISEAVEVEMTEAGL